MPKITWLFMALLVSLPPVPVAASDPLVMGVFPRRNAKITYQLFNPMAKYLSTELGREVRLETSKNFKTFWQGVVDKRYDLVHYNQYHYIISNRDFGYKVILKNEEFGSPTISGVIAVRKDSNIYSVKDLKGKKIVFGGGPRAMISYIVPRFLLANEGLSSQDYTELFAKNPPNAVFSAYYKQSDAAGAGEVVLGMAMVKNQIDTGTLRVLVKSEPLAHLPWAVKGDMPAPLRKQIQSALLALNQTRDGRALLRSAKLTGISLATDEEFNPHRAIAFKVFGK